MIRRTVAGLIATALLVLVAACTGSSAESAGTPTPSPFAVCPTATPPPSVGVEPAGSRVLPSVSLPCFTGGAMLDLAHLGRPAVINFWSSDCGPCRQEMPELQKFATAQSGRIAVIGVDSLDTRTAAASAGVDFGATYPMLFDPDGNLLRAWGSNYKPVTLLVDAAGVVRHQDVSGALTESRLDSLVHTYLGLVL